MEHSTTNNEFIQLIFDDLNEGARPLVCGFPGDPNKDGDWFAVPWKGRSFGRMRPDWNTYVTTGSFYRDEINRRYHRRKAQFSALHCVMIDDLGSGEGSKLSLDRLMVKPTALIETSPDNYQAYIKLSEPITDRLKAEQLINSLIHTGLMADKDPGMSGVTRVGRMPEGINGKPKYGGWTVRLAQWNPGTAYYLNDLDDKFRLGLNGGAFCERSPRQFNDIPLHLDPYLPVLQSEGLILAKPRGKIVKILCPWISQHTDRIQSGTAYIIGGGFKCHHGHCEDRKPYDLEQWLESRGHNVESIRNELNWARNLAVLTEMEQAEKP